MSMPTGVHRGFTRRSVVRGAATALCAGLLGGGLAQTRPERSSLSVSVGGKSSLYHLPLTVAEQLGYFKSEGLDVEIADYPSAIRAIQTVSSGAAEVVACPYEHTIYQSAKGQAFQAFVIEGRAPQMAFGVAVRAMPNYQSPLDLRGRRIGITAPGSSSNMLAQLLLNRAGVQASEVNFIAVGASAGAISALRAGQVDAICSVDPVITALEQRGDIKVVADARSTRGTHELFGGAMPAGCLMASPDFIQRHPGTVQALASAIVHALKWLQTAGPSDLIRTVPEAYLLGDRALYLAAFNKIRDAISPDGLMPEDGARTTLRALSAFDAQVRAEKLELSRTFTNDFARRAKVRSKA